MLSKTLTSRLFSICQFGPNELFSFFYYNSKILASKHRTKIGSTRFQKRHYSSGTSSNVIVLESDYESVTTPTLDLPQYLWQDVEKWGDKPMVTCGVSGRSYTFKATREMCARFGSALVSQLDFKKGQVLGLLLPNSPEYPIAIHGAVEAGIIVTFMNPLYTADEIYRQFENAEVKSCVTIPELLPLIEKIAPRLKNLQSCLVIGAKNAKISASSDLKIIDFKEFISSQAINSFEQNEPNDVVVLPYSSGTTGLPKGVMLTHQNCIVNIEQLLYYKFSRPFDNSESNQETHLSILPFFHIYGFNVILNLAIRKGIHIVTLPKFTPEAYIQCLLKYQPTSLFVVPSLLLFLASHPSVKSEYLKSVTDIVSGAASATKSLFENFKNKFGHRMRVRQGYGMTELSPCALICPLDYNPEKEGSAGKLVPNTSARIVSLTNGADQPAFQSGELYIKGPQVMKGYWKNDKATQETVDSENWLHTGDVAYYDNENFFYIIDRTKELIKVKGNQVSPTELENLILQLPQIEDVAVAGVPDTLADEVPKAFIVVKPNVKITEEEIMNYVKDKVVTYKRLQGGVAFVNSIPRNIAGKILRNELLVLHTRSKQKN